MALAVESGMRRGGEVKRGPGRTTERLLCWGNFSDYFALAIFSCTSKSLNCEKSCKICVF